MAWEILGEPRAGGILLVGDHASNNVPADIDLGVAATVLSDHVAVDIGVRPMAQRLIADGIVDAACLGAVSRLVVDLNRDETALAAIPESSDGHVIPGNRLDRMQREARLERFHRPYHAALDHLLVTMRPSMLLSLHSFTPRLASAPDQVRPWPIGVLYNEDDRLARVALNCFAAQQILAGDQLPYSGKLLNYTMDRHAEARGLPYLGIEMRQDEIADAAGQARMARWLGFALMECRTWLNAQQGDRMARPDRGGTG